MKTSAFLALAGAAIVSLFAACESDHATTTTTTTEETVTHPAVVAPATTTETRTVRTY